MSLCFSCLSIKLLSRLCLFASRTNGSGGRWGKRVNRQKAQDGCLAGLGSHRWHRRSRDHRSCLREKRARQAEPHQRSPDNRPKSSREIHPPPPKKVRGEERSAKAKKVTRDGVVGGGGTAEEKLPPAPKQSDARPGLWSPPAASSDLSSPLSAGGAQPSSNAGKVFKQRDFLLHKATPTKTKKPNKDKHREKETGKECPGDGEARKRNKLLAPGSGKNPNNNISGYSQVSPMKRGNGEVSVTPKGQVLFGYSSATPPPNGRAKPPSTLRATPPPTLRMRRETAEPRPLLPSVYCDRYRCTVTLQVYCETATGVLCTVRPLQVYCETATGVLCDRYRCTVRPLQVYCDRYRCTVTATGVLCTVRPLQVYCETATGVLCDRYRCTVTATGVLCDRYRCTVRPLQVYCDRYRCTVTATGVLCDRYRCTVRPLQVYCETATGVLCDRYRCTVRPLQVYCETATGVL
ncbi:unnamed protein product [Boreogadus saida]